MTQIARRTILKAGAGAAAVAATSVGFSAATKNGSTNTVEPFFGKFQSGISTAPQEHATWVAFNLLPETNLDELGRLLRVWTTDASRLMAGKEALVDNESTLAIGPSNLTITFGFGPRVIALSGKAQLEDLPSFGIDQLDPKWSGGDLVVQVCGNDQVKIHHAIRELTTDAKPFAQIKWRQTGFLPSLDLSNSQTPRNLMGQKDGTANFNPDSAEFNQTVWKNETNLVGATTMVIRRIQMKLDDWEKLSPDLKEKVIGRKLDSGAPLSGGDEFTPADLDQTDHHGLVIPGDAHMRRAKTGEFKIHRRSYSYQTESDASGNFDQGLIFVAFQQNLDQFIKIQQRLDAMDSLNTWTTPIGSAVFLIPPGCENGGWIGQTLI
jgi:dye decolorizing peroxidase